jgi:hypothetical protein
MATSSARSFLLGLFLVLAIVASAFAGAEEYEFRLVEDKAKQGEEVTIAVTLVHVPTGRAVSDAVIFARRLDMAPDGMAEMRSDLEPLPPAAPGVYQFKTTLGMEGRWQLQLAAKVQGVAETVQGRLVLNAVN